MAAVCTYDAGRPDAPYELERRQRQVDAVEDHVRRHYGRKPEEAGVVGFLQVVGGGGPYA
jgi:hypothetical protein